MNVMHMSKTLREYAGVIELMAKELLDKEVIDGVRVREIIEEYEKENQMESRLVPLEEA